MTDTTAQPTRQAAPPADWWRDPSSLTEADKQRLGRMQDREAEALDVTSDEHEYVWGFRQDREHERRRWLASEAAFTREQMHEQLGVRGHAMTWQPSSYGSPQVLTWNGECADCGATASAGAMSSSPWRGGKDARKDEPCSGPGTAWQAEMLRERQAQRLAGAVAQFGQEVKEQHDKAWLREQGIEVDST